MTYGSNRTSRTQSSIEYGERFARKRAVPSCNLTSTEAKPFSLIAHANGTFLGAASLIASDVDNRSLLTPWVAAVWVEAGYRGRGIGTSRVEAVVKRAFALGERELFLHCAESRRPFYEKRAWQLLERGVPTSDMHILRRQAPITSDKLSQYSWARLDPLQTSDEGKSLPVKRLTTVFLFSRSYESKLR